MYDQILFDADVLIKQAEKQAYIHSQVVIDMLEELKSIIKYQQEKIENYEESITLLYNFTQRGK